MAINWKYVKYFQCHEFEDPNYPGSGAMICPQLLVLLIRLRLDTINLDEPHGWPMVIHNEVGGAVDVDGSWGHANNSYHLKNKGFKAVDFHFKTDNSLREQFHKVVRTGFTGIGIYYDWKSMGFHVDIRPKAMTQVWKRSNGKYEYFLV